MKASKITMELIVDQLNGCCALLYALAESADHNVTSPDALTAVSSLLKMAVDALSRMMLEQGEVTV